MTRFTIRILYYMWLLFMTRYICLCDLEWFLETERPVVTYYDPKYLANLTAKSVRYSRKDPLHYYNLYIENVVPIDRSIMVHLYFYQLLTNVYKPSFIEIHDSFCHFFQEDEILGSFFWRMLEKHPEMHGFLKCPIVPGHYHLENISFPSNRFIQQFPFDHTRLYVNITAAGKNVIASGYVDVDKKSRRVRNKNKKS